jgi:hypothetical protein
MSFLHLFKFWIKDTYFGADSLQNCILLQCLLFTNSGKMLANNAYLITVIHLLIHTQGETHMNINRTLKLSLVTLIVIILSMVIYGFAAANVVPGSFAGDGSGAISGYTISAIHYGLNAANPGNIDNVIFTLSAAPAAGSTIKISLDGTNWYTCSNITTAATCITTAPQATALLATNLRVVVAQ